MQNKYSGLFLNECTKSTKQGLEVDTEAGWEEEAEGRRRRREAGQPWTMAGKMREGSVWIQKVVGLKARQRGCHYITDEVLSALPELKNISIGVAHLTIQHTSASICLNENWDKDVLVDTEMMLNKIVPENMPYRHSCEGPDDMPGHVKASLIGSSLSVPITDGKFNLGTWQGLWLCEHRNHAGSRKVVVTAQGAPK